MDVATATLTAGLPVSAESSRPVRDATTAPGTPTAPTAPSMPGAAAAPAALVETHTSILIFLGDRVYKVKKSADLGFLDFRTRQARLAACQAEVDLNRRLAPDVYLGVADVQGPDGALCDHMVVMRRLPADRRLSTLVTAGVDVTDELRATARLLAAFHTRCETSAEIADAGSSATLGGLWEEGLRGVEPYLGTVLDGATVDAIGRLAARFLAGREPLLRERQRLGLVRDGHGDLLAGDIYCLEDGPRILDCLEFDQRLRVGDVLGDIGFLAMDLESLGRPDLAAFLLAHYRQYAAESHPRSLADLYIAYRAFVRCKVACTRYAQGVESAAAEARALAALALSHLRQGRVRLVLVGGVPGSGRGALAAGLADAEEWTLLRAEDIGLVHGPGYDLAGTDPTGAEAAGRDAAGRDATDVEAGYDELFRRARVALERGESVVIDAAWERRADRDRAAELARVTAADLVQLRTARGGSGSSAGGGLRWERTPGPVRRMAAASSEHPDPWPEATTLPQGAGPDALLRAARRAAG
ncbi:hypothetical protein Ga0074812_1362 [Parafrankia irregularis]|uniref:Aminoglycoside phosphotransferase domain-containing protein n=1 Tax=Parafrankia irregularis TaxID=795642 RepID=A0A0S4QYG1_9ACTN|nr:MULTISPECIES: AAA family ATPase [Parafrankia]MBE3203497.1 hypothetical protein [Parafrankia sp. CH37]CUU60142.1 hypothetical protein Ga0074812_1362 [Parafrankia irregularis]